MSSWTTVLRRELQFAFATPLAYLFLVAYAVMATVATVEIGGLYERGQADLTPYFLLQPWLLLWLAPALSMRTWAEERRHGTMEYLLTQPISVFSAIIAKWLSGVVVLIIALAMTVPLWLTVTYLGQPDHGAIIAGYVATVLLGSSILSIGSAVSASTRHQVGAFIGTVLLGAALLLIGLPIVSDLLRDRLPLIALEALSDLSPLAHFQAIARGVIGLDDVLYFTGLTAVGLIATLVIVNRVRDIALVVAGRRVLDSVALAVLVVLFAVVALASPRIAGRARIDLTDERIYTLTPATHHLIDSVDEPITLTLFASTRTIAASPRYAESARRVRELLRDIASGARGRIHLVVIDPSPFSSDEDRAVDAGLRSVPVGESGDRLWLGLVAESAVGHAAIDVFDPDESAYLEYRVARLIRQASRPHKAVVALVSTLPNHAPALDQPSWTTDDQLRDQFDVRDVQPDAHQLPAGIDALLVLHPKGLSLDLLTAIDRYISRGGNALIALDPDAQFDSLQDDFGVGIDHASTLEPLLHSWGIEFNAAAAVGDLDNALLVGASNGDRPVRHLGFVGFGTGNLDTADPLTRGLHRVNFATPGYLQIHAVAGIKATALVETSAVSSPIKIADLASGVTPETLRHGFTPTGERYVIAAHLRGRFPAAFPLNSVENPQPGNIVLVADTDWLADALWIRSSDANGRLYKEPWANNGDFLLNSVDELTGGGDLIGIRGHEPKSRPFTRLEEIRNRSDKQLFARAEALNRRLGDINQRIMALTDGGHTAVTASVVQHNEIAAAEIERRNTMRALRSIQHDLDHDAGRLWIALYTFDLIAAPLLVLIIAFLLLRRRRIDSNR